MHPVLFASLVLFNGNNLDGWKSLRGNWRAENGAIVCKEPGAIRSSFESDFYNLQFEYRATQPGDAVVVMGTSCEGTGGHEHALKGSAHADVWQKGSIVFPEKRPVFDPDATEKDPGRQRGFIVFKCSRPGLEIRNLKVMEYGFKSLFDGKTTKGWEPVGKVDPDKPNWTVKDGTLRCGHLGGSWLRTLESYDNFVIRLEYWLPPGGNSGIYLHAPLQGRVSQTGQEIQLLDDAGWTKKLAPSQSNGSIYSGIAPEVRVPAPAEEWNAIEVFAQGKRIRTVVNGVQIYDARLDDTARDAQLLKHPLATRLLTGFIGLQDHTGGPRFRNIRLRVLPAESRPAS